MAVMEKMGIGIGMMNFDAPTVFAHLQNMQLNTSVQISGNNNNNNNVEEEVEQKNVEQNTEQNNADNKKEEEQNLEQIFSDTEENNGKAKKNVRDLVDLLSKLNPFAKEFVPTSHLDRGSHSTQIIDSNNKNNKRKKVNKNQGKRPVNNRMSRAQREENIRRTVYVSDIDHQVTEEQLAALFLNCGQVVDCRICGDPNSVLRFAFVEFANESGARAALSLAGTMLGYYPVRVLPSKTAIAPVNPTFLPRSEEEREKCARTIYCTNIDKKVSQSDLKVFFETLCGGVSRLRLLGDFHHSTRIAFVEFFMAESAMAALNCSGAVLGQLPIRVSPSKTPVRTRSPRPTMQ